MAKLINPGLYQRLCEVFGKKGVKVHRPGRKGAFRYENAASDNYKSMRLTKAGDDVGEEYSVSCIFCGDRKQRLYFNHFWGTLDKYSGKRILWLCHCYNEECQQDPDNRKELAKLVLGDRRVRLESKNIDVEERELRDVRLPGLLQRLDDLALSDRQHPAVRWCLVRGYDPRVLGDQYGVGYCFSTYADGDLSFQRIVAPFYVAKDGETKLAGWTARKIFEDAPGPKWLHSASPTGSIVYGLNEAAKYKVLTVVEGPGDKWAVGPRAAAVLGKTLRDAKADRIVAAMQKHRSKDQIIAVMLDPLQSPVERRRGRPHPRPPGRLRREWRACCSGPPAGRRRG